MNYAAHRGRRGARPARRKERDQQSQRYAEALPRPPIVFLLVTTLVTAGLVRAGAQAEVRGFFDLPINGGSREYERLGLLPAERGIAIGLLARQIYGQSIGYAERVLARRQLAQVIGDQVVPGEPEPEGAPPGESTPITIPIPMSADVWRDLLEVPARGDLFIPLVSNRSALLVCAGAAATDASVRSLLQDDRGLLRWLVKMAPAGFALVARSLRIVNGKVEVPGGAAAEPMWEALAAERASRPADFIRALTSRDGGRLAWFFDTLSTVGPERLAMALSASPAEPAAERARALYASFRAADQNWRLEEHPFLRGAADPWMITTRIAVRDGAVASPAWAWLWQAVFDRVDIPRREAASIPRTSAGAVTLSWLAQQISTGNPRERRDHFDMVRFAQGVFGSAGAADELDVLVALGGYRRFRSALLALDRMEITVPAIHAQVVDAARRVSDRSGRDQRHSIVAFQAALAIVERARLTRAIDQATAERLVRTLCEAVDRDVPTSPAVARWMTATLVPALPPLLQRDQFSDKTTYESTILQAMAGPAAESGGGDFVWEGLTYRVDLAAGERQRIHRIREQLQSSGLDRAIASAQPSQLTDALLTLVYVPALGDPEGPALLSRDVPQRHDFGFEAGTSPRRDFLPWLPPREQLGDGLPWRVGGSILGLDLGLARLALRRIDENDMPAAPSINLNDEITLARTTLALNPRDLTNEARDELVAALARGRDRISGAGRNLSALVSLAREVRFPAALEQALPWMVARTPESIPALFGLREMLWLGRPALPRPELDRWGVYAEPLDSRLRTVMPTPAAWEEFAGRAEAGMMGTQVPDLTLRLAQETARLKLPARLIPALLVYATQDFWHDVQARFPDDLPAMTRQALALSSSRVEDYVAALAGDGPLRAK
jgi:hypothetical protein